MPIRIYDFHNDVRNVLVTPQIRSRFLKMQPGQVANLHSHDLGHEIFLILEGRALFQIDGEQAELGPGQMCIALADQIHSVSVVGEEPMTMYLSVTPHIQPTHTGRFEDGQKMPLRFMPSSAYDIEPDISVTDDQLIDSQTDAAEAASMAASDCARIHREMSARLKQAIADGDTAVATNARDAMWAAIYKSFKAIHHLGSVWNELAPRIVPNDESR